MKAFELTGEVDEQHKLRAEAPVDLPAGPVRLLVLVPEEDDAGHAWINGIAGDWAADLKDAQQDIYSVEDGQPVNGSR